jgi:hypothetical protein
MVNMLGLVALLAVQLKAAQATPGATPIQPNQGLITPGPSLDLRQLLGTSDPRFIGWQVEDGTGE